MTPHGKRSVLVVTGLLPGPGGRSFSGNFVVQHLRALADHYHVVVLNPHASFRPALSGLRSAGTRFAPLDVYFLPYFPIRPLLRRIIGFFSARQDKNTRGDRYRAAVKRHIARRLEHQARRLHKRYSFQLVHGQELFVGDEAAAIGHQLQIPSAVTIHALYDFHEASFGRSTMCSILENLKVADQLIGVSHLVRQSYEDRTGKPIAVISDGYTPPVVVPVNDAVRAFVGNRKVILYAGYLIESKRVHLLLEAARAMKEKWKNSFCLIVVGVGPMQGDLRRLGDSCGLDNDVLFAGEIQPSRISGYYAIADVVAQASVSEGFAMTCLEGMAYGKPFVCTRNAGITGFIEDGKEAFVVEPDNVEQLADRLHSLLTDDTLRARMGENAKQTSLSFLWPEKIQETMRLYGTILAERNRMEQ